MFDVEAAQKELENKTIHDIQEETVYKWGSRALAAINKFDSDSNALWLFDAKEYYHEALEHAALCDPGVLDRLAAESIGQKIFERERLVAKGFNRG